MKRIIIFAAMATLITSVCNAQLKVNTSGNIILGDSIAQTPTNNNTISKYNTTINVSKNWGGLYVRNYSNATAKYGINIYLQSSNDSPIGINSAVFGGFTNTLSCGINGVSTGGNNTIGVFGGAEDTPSTINTIGVCGSVGSYAYLPTSGSNYYAGYFQGDVRATGSIYGTLLSPTSISSNSDSATLMEVATDRQSVTENLKGVGLLLMERVNQDGSMAANKKPDKEIVKINLLDRSETKTISTTDRKDPIQTKLSSISYGLAADQLKEVYPELVYEDKEGNYSINYVEMVPLLVQSIKELSAEVAILKEQLGIQDPKKTAMKARSKQAEDADEVQLTIPDKAQRITLSIYDLTGKQIRTTEINESGNINLSDYTKGLPIGTYAYNLIVDGKKQKARKIIVQHM